MVKRRHRRDGGCVRSIVRGMDMLEARNGLYPHLVISDNCDSSKESVY